MDKKINWRRSFCDAVCDVALCLFVIAILGMGASAQETTEARVRGDAGLYPADGTLTCTQPAPTPERVKLNIPPQLFERAKLKARLADLLRESLFDDAHGIVNVAREREIKDLLHRLERGRT